MGDGKGVYGICGEFVEEIAAVGGGVIVISISIRKLAANCVMVDYARIPVK